MPRMSYEGIFPANWSCPVCGAGKDDFLPPGRRRGVRTLFAPISSFSEIVARLQWDAAAIDLAPDGRAWPGLPAARHRRLTTLLAGFRVAEDAVAEQLAPFGDATADTLAMWVFFLQRRDEERHALFFDRIAAEVLGLPGATLAERRAAARPHVPAAVLELFEVWLPALAAELAARRTGLGAGRGRRRGLGRRRSPRHARAHRAHVRPATGDCGTHRGARGGVAGPSTGAGRGGDAVPTARTGGRWRTSGGAGQLGSYLNEIPRRIR
jgi:hypothetical protein